VKKPLSIDLEAAKECESVVGQAGTPLMIALNKRFDPTISEFARRVKCGVVGRGDVLSLIGKDPEPPPEAYVLHPDPRGDVPGHDDS
jgi:myo-inositol 2-dehydrogenase/D-chiro-inositol 1-dehydrogenase